MFFKNKNMESTGPGHYCYGCKEFFHDSNMYVHTHKGCKGQKSLGICVDSKEFGKYHPYNLENKSNWDLIQIIQELSEDVKKLSKNIEKHGKSNDYLI
jgi:hypothetical protein